MGFGVAFGLVFALIMAVAIPLAGLMFIVAVANAFTQANEGGTQRGSSDTPASAASKRRMKEPEPEINMCPRCGAVTDNKKVCKCGAKTKPIEEALAEEEWA